MDFHPIFWLIKARRYHIVAHSTIQVPIRLFCRPPSYDEKIWGAATVRTVASQVALLTQLKVFQTLGRFLAADEIPRAIGAHIGAALGAEGPDAFAYAKNTFYRHQIACEYLAHRAVNSAQWQRVCESLSPAQIVALDALLETDEADKESAFARLCRGPGKATRENLKVLIEHHPWLRELPNPTGPLACIADTKVLQWANEAKRLKAPELREYTAPRRLALLLATIRVARGGRERLQKDRAEHLQHEHKNWRPFAHRVFAPYRSVLFRLASEVPLQGTKAAEHLLDAVFLIADGELRETHLTTNVVMDFFLRDWRTLLYDNAEDEQVQSLNRKQMEVATILRTTIKSTLLAANVRRGLKMEPVSGASTPLTAIP